MTHTAKAGKLLMIHHGEYSDHTVDGFFQVLRDFDPAKELERYLEDRPEQREDYHFEHREFIAYLIKEKLIDEIVHGSLYLGAYNSATDFNFHPVLHPGVDQ